MSSPSKFRCIRKLSISDAIFRNPQPFFMILSIRNTATKGTRRSRRKRRSERKDKKEEVYVDQVNDSNNVINLSGVDLTFEQLSLLNKGLGFAPVQDFQLFQTVIDLQRFTRKLTLKKFFTTRSSFEVTDSPELGSQLPVCLDDDGSNEMGNLSNLNFKETCVLSDMEELLEQQGENVNNFSQAFFGNHNSGLKRKSIFCPNYNRGPYITTFEGLVERDLRLLAQGFTQSSIQTKNLTYVECQQLEHLKSRKDIMFRKADKGGALVVLSTTQYRQEALRQLSDVTHYEPLIGDPTAKFSLLLDELISFGKILYVIDKKEVDYLSCPHPVIPVFHHLPKIHKSLTDPLGRPIVASIGSLGDGLSRYVDSYLQPLVFKLPSFVKDSADVMIDLGDVVWKSHYRWVTLDVVSLYSIIQHQQGLSAVNHFLNTSQLSTSLCTFLIESITFLLTHNYFLFDSRFYLQLLGTAMGTSFAPSYANLFMGFWEAQFIYHSNNTYRSNIVFFKRYIDDLIMIWDGDESSLKSFVNTLNTNDLNIRFTYEHNINCISFLDLLLYIDHDMTIQSQIFRKPNSRNTLLSAKSCHPWSLVKSIPKAQFVRLRRLCTNDDSFIAQSKELTNRFLARGYTQKIIQDAFESAESMDRSVFSAKKKKKRNNVSLTYGDECPLFISTYSRQAQNIRNIINKHWATLALDKDLTQFVKNGPKFTYRKAQTLGSHLSPSLFHTTPEYKNIRGIPKGFYSCGNCSMCKYACNTKVIKYEDDKKSHVIKAFLNCNTTFTVYLLQCGCSMRYVGRTKRTLKTRIAEHVRFIKKKDDTHPVPRHFTRCSRGGIANFSFMALEHISQGVRGGDREGTLNRREMYWIYTLRTLHPLGINQEWELKHFLAG
ncbi:uncharacterized protein LOC142497064 isoform X2 [Ascaphus truei]